MNGYCTDVLFSEAMTWMKRCADKREPFCFWCGSYQPHRSYPAGIRVRSGMDPAKVLVPPYLPDNATTRSDSCDYFHQAGQFDLQCAAILAALEHTGPRVI